MSLPPGPAEPAAVQTARWILRPLPYLEACARRYGDAFTVHWLGAGTVVMVSSPELIKQVFAGDPEVLHAGEGNALLEPMLGKHSLLLLDEAEHLRQRRLLLPAFHGERMQAYEGVMREVAEASFERWPVGRAFALHPHMQAITLDVILRTVFGLDEAARHGQLRALLVEFLESTANPLALVPGLLGFNVFERAPWSHRARLKRAIDDALYGEIARRRTRAGGGTDVLSMMLEARDEQGRAMTDVELRDELVTLLLAGHETTATALAWTFERLLATPATFVRLADELAGGRDEYLDAVIKEVLRVRPIVPIVARSVTRPFQLGAWTIPPGVRIAPNIYLAHRREATYPDAGGFLPERWLGVKPDPYAWLPFGGSIRRCIGMAFALFEMRVVLQTIVPRARLHLADGPARVARRAITLAPAGGTRVVLDERRAKAAPASAA